MEENIWKEIFKDEVFAINGHEYKLDDVIFPSTDKSGKIDVISTGFRPVGNDNDSEIITIEIPMSAAFLFTKYLVCFKGTFGEVKERLRELQASLQAEGEGAVNRLKSAGKAFFEELKKKG